MSKEKVLVALAIALGLAVMAFAVQAKPGAVIPKHIDARTGFISSDVAETIDRANANYTSEERQQIIDFCQERAAVRLGVEVLASGGRRPPPGVVEELKEAFQTCAVGMIRAWEAEDASQ